MKDFTSITEHLENVRGGYDGSDGGYCSTDARVNSANGRSAICGPQPTPTPSPLPTPTPTPGIPMS